MTLHGDGPDRVFVGGLPYFFTEANVRELLECFGALRGFDLAIDTETGNSKGYALCVYQDPSVIDIVCAALSGINMGDKALMVRRANQHETAQIASQRLMLQPPTKVVSLTHMVIEEDLIYDEDYEYVLEDMKIECGTFSSLVKVVIPRPNLNGEPVAGVGKVFLEYVDTESSRKARAGLNGRMFHGRVVARFYPENKFNEGEYDG